MPPSYPTKRLLFLLLVLPIMMVAAGLAHGEDPAKSRARLSELISPLEFSSVNLSPDGKHAAMLQYNGFGNTVMLADTARMKFKGILGTNEFKGRLPRSVRWIDNELMAVDFTQADSESIDLTGRTVAKLGATYIGRAGPLTDAAVQEVLVFRDDDHETLGLVNPRTGDKRRYPVPLPGKLLRLAFDAEGTPRAATTRDTTFWTEQTTISQWYRPSATAPWQLLEQGPVTHEGWHPLYVPLQADSIVVQSRQGRDTWGIFRYDTKKREVVELMAGHPTDDIVAVEVADNEVFERVITDGLKTQTHWFDARWAQLQLSMDKALPGRVNLLRGDPQGKVLVFSRSDVDPGRWYIFDTVALSLQEVAPLRPSVRVEAMRPMQTLRYAARDSVQIPAYLTVPEGDGPWPLVVLIHGGPTARDRWAWDGEVQWLASRGYAVFQPQFRGSTGFGARFEQAGRAQWGLAMQDDITDGVQHLIAQKMVLPDRICISGGSYGGYAALWGLVKTPELYRCGISFAGVSDIDKMLRDRNDTNKDPASREYLRFMLDVSTVDKPRFGAVSPLKNADRIRVPVLLAHGEEDERVFPSHSKLMVAELKARGKVHEWLLFPRERHGLTYTANKKTYYETMIEFLDRYIGPSDSAPKSAASPPESATPASAPAQTPP